MDSRAQRENAAANNGDNDIDDDALIEPLRRVMKLSGPKLPLKSTLKPSMNLMHASWRATQLTETQKMKVSLLTDYFACK